jgi:hypothetical protein
VREDVFDGSEGERDEPECGVDGVEAVGPVGDQADPAVQSFVAGIVHAEAHRGQDAGTALADGAGRGDQGFQAGALRLRAEAVSKMPASSSGRSPAKTARRASFSAYMPGGPKTGKYR